MNDEVTQEQIDAIIEAMAKIEEAVAAEIYQEIQDTTSDYEADDLSCLRDETLAKADYLRTFKAKIKAQSTPLLSQEEAFQRAVKAGLFAGLVSKPEGAA